MKKSLFAILACFMVTASLFNLNSCAPKLEAPDSHTGTVSMKSPVFLGGSHMAGFRDWALFDKGQQNGLGDLLGQQIGIAAGTNLEIGWPMGSETGLAFNPRPWESVFTSRGNLGKKTDCEGVESTSVLRDTFGMTLATPLLQASNLALPRNLAVPYSSISDWDDNTFGTFMDAGGVNPYYPRISSSPGLASIQDDALSLNPDFVVAWPGLEEILTFAAQGATGVSPIDGTSFDAQLRAVLDPLFANGAAGAIANIPDFQHFPFFTTVPPLGLEISASLADSLNDLYVTLPIEFNEGPNGFIIADPTAVGGVRQITGEEHLTLMTPTDSLKCYFLGILFSWIPDRYVLDKDEILEIDLLIDNYNTAIRAYAEEKGIALVDMHSFFADIHDGYNLDGVDYSTEFVSGGFFSSDALHPTEKGYGLITNEFIRAINAQYEASVPTINVSNMDGIIFP